MRNFRTLEVWRKAHQLVLIVYKVTKKFPKEELYGLTSQMRRAGTSIPTNIAEGCAKYSQLDFARYLNISLGSDQELEYLSFLSFELGYIKETEYVDLDARIHEVKAMLISLNNKVHKTINK